jgi:hypothetical protein
MPRCLMLTPFPLAVPRHGGQVRAASLARALARIGWQVDTMGIYHSDHFPAQDWGALDIVIDDAALARQAREDMLFADLHVARGAAADRDVVDQLRLVLTRLQPDVVQVEHPWSWSVLQAALTSVRERPRLVYSSHNLEWRARSALLSAHLALARPSSDRLIAETRVLETAVARDADLTLSISDTEGEAIGQETGRAIAYVPPVSDLAEAQDMPHGGFARAARDDGCRYAAMIGSAYWPNVEGFFSIFPHGLGFLARGEQVWVAGSLGAALCADARYKDCKSVNDARLRAWGYVADADKASFFAAAACIVMPVTTGAGAKQKTADALASNCPVITTSHAIEGYGPLIRDVLDQGVYVADTPRTFRALVRCALREGLPACPPEIRSRVGLARMAETLAPLYAGLLSGPG